MNKIIEKEDWNKLQSAITDLLNIQNKMFGWYNEEEMMRTPERITEFYKEWSNSNHFKFTIFPVTDRDQMIRFDDITFFSMCAHHLLPFFGKVSIAYLPEQYVGGASKFSRLVKKYSSKPTSQEELTSEIADNINDILKPRFVFVRVEARHLCQEMRGIRSVGEFMRTSSLRYIPEMEKNLVHLKEEATR